MAFRKMFLAVAAVAALAAIPASAQAPFQALTCNVTTNAPYIRYQGLTEQVGDIIITCTGGTPTPAGVDIPVDNFAVNIQSTNITSQLLGVNLPSVNGSYPYSEAVLAINEATPTDTNLGGNPNTAPYAAGAPVQNPNPASNTGDPHSPGTGNGGGLGVSGESYAAGGTNYNLFQGYQFDAHTIRFDGVPVDAPGTNQVVIFRITNIRVDATPYNAGTLAGAPVTANLSITGTQPIAINNIAPYVVAYPQNGIVFAGPTGVSGSVCQPGGSVTIPVQEGFASSFKRRTYFWGNDTITAPTFPGAISAAPYGSPQQNVFGFPYFSESGFYNPGLTWVQPGLVGLATNGTRIWVSLSNIQKGLTVTAPAVVYLDGGVAASGIGSHSGVMRLLNTPPVSNAGVGAYNPATSNVSYTSSADGSSVTFVYEVLFSDPAAIETAQIVFPVTYAAGSVNYTIPPTYIGAQAQFAPIDGTNVASTAVHSIPRFAPGPQPVPPANTFFLTGCQCDLLFPYVTDGSGYVTGLAISNTTLDPYGTQPENGYVQLFYYPNFNSAFTPANNATGITTWPNVATPTKQSPFTQISASPLAAGDQLLMTLNGGSYNPGFNLAATPGFSGYLIAISGFQYCHGYAFIADSTVSKFAEGYVALVLDKRTFLPRQGGPNSPYPNYSAPAYVQGEWLGQ